MKRHKILLLNPPGDQRYIRDYYCSHVSKANYIWHPYDLFVQSGILGQDHDLVALDANIDNLTFEQAAQALSRMDFDAILMLTGAVSWKNDFSFAGKYLQGKTLIASGDVTVANGRDLLERYPFLDATLQDFTLPAINQFLKIKDQCQGGIPDTSEPIPGLLYRNHEGNSI
ncbi:MAG: hypothetical protein H3C63_17985, partial [Candidatus Omnitrophica bacterium]|nr:hypothetical protein [Candidatus Omnitrophota bacterium]